MEMHANSHNIITCYLLEGVVWGNVAETVPHLTEN